ncbi:MAG: hypothetical protein HRF49_11460 [bacterium]|jgi:IS605 OrfB family transposase
MSRQKITKTFTAMLVPGSPRIASYLWLTHILFNRQVSFMVKEYLHLRRAAEIARYEGTIAHRLSASLEKVKSDKGKSRISRHFNEFARRFMDRYSLSYEKAAEVALKMGIMSDYFLIAPQGEDGKPLWSVPDECHAFVEQLTQVKKKGADVEDADFANVCKANPEISIWLADFHRRGILLFDRKESGLLPWHRLVMSVAARYIRSQGEKRKSRESERKSWAESRAKFIEENGEFFNTRLPFFESYERERTASAQKELDSSQPGRIAKHVHIRGPMVKGIGRVRDAWAGEDLWKPKSPPAVETIPDRNNRREAILLELIKEDNESIGDHAFFRWLAHNADAWPEFADDFKLLLDYNNNFLKDRCPQSIGFSAPDWRVHPQWYELEEFTGKGANKHYKLDLSNQNLFLRLAVPKSDVLKKGSVNNWLPECAELAALSESEIEALTANPDEVAIAVVPVPFKPDARIRKYVIEEAAPDAPDKYAYQFRDKLLGEKFHMRFGGIKIQFKPRPVKPGKSKPYVYFSARVIVPFERPKRPKTAADVKPGSRVLSIDLGYRSRAYGVVREYHGPSFSFAESVQIWAGPVVPPGGRHLAHVDAHEWKHRQKRSEAQKTPDGKMKFLPRKRQFDARMTEHIIYLKNDIAKQTAHAIIAKAVEHRANVIVVEKLDGYRPSTDRTRRENRRLRTTAFRSLLHELGTYRTSGGNYVGIDRAGAYGIATVEKPSAYTSKVCHKCGWPGVRYSEVPYSWFVKREDLSKPKADRLPITHRKIRGGSLTVTYQETGNVLIQQGGKLFCCSNPQCEVVKINADYNAAQNLQREFAGEELVSKSGRGKEAMLYLPGGAVGMKAADFWKKAESDARSKLAARGFKLAGTKS